MLVLFQRDKDVCGRWWWGWESFGFDFGKVMALRNLNKY
jgi:hypothetical protein